MKAILRLFVGVGCLFLLAGAVIMGPVSAQSFSNWTPPEMLGGGWWQSITVDREGRAHIGWYGQAAGGNGSDVLRYVQREINGEWSQIADVIYTGDGGWTVRNSLDVDSQGRIFAYYRGTTDHYLSHSNVSEATGALGWSRPIRMGSGYYLDMLIDEQNVIHLVSSTHNTNIMDPDNEAQMVSQEQNECAFCADLLYHRSTDGGRTWSRTINISNTWEGSERVSIWQARSGRIYIHWDEGYDWYLGRGQNQDARFVYSDDNGETWSDPIILGGAGTPYRPMLFALTEMLDGTLMAVWRNAGDDRSIYYQTSANLGQDWTEPAAIAGLTARSPFESQLDDYELIVDLMGNIYLFVVGHPDGGERSIYQVEYRQDRWLFPQIVFQGGPAVWPEWPRAAIGPQNEIHLTWFVREVVFTRTGINNTAVLNVYYSQRPPTLPNRPTQAFEPTPTPIPIAVVVPTFAPTITPFPTVAPLEPLNPRTTADLYAIQTLLSAAFVCAVLCGGIIFMTGFRPRR